MLSEQIKTTQEQPLESIPRIIFKASPTYCLRLGAVCLALLVLAGCSMGQAVVRTSLSILDGGVEAMDRETDLELARLAIPAQLKLLEGMIVEDPRNVVLLGYAAQALCGYAFGFVEMEDQQRAGKLYRRGFEHTVIALRKLGLKSEPANWRPDQLKQDLARMGDKAIPTMFWAAYCLANWTNMNRDSPAGLAEAANAAALMERVLALDETYYYGGPHIFFGVYYGSRSPMLGGDYDRSQRHFDRAKQITDGKFLITDVLYAEYLARQRLDQKAFHNRLTRVINAAPDLFPEQALVNAISQDRARKLLVHEEAWF